MTDIDFDRLTLVDAVEHLRSHRLTSTDLLQHALVRAHSLPQLSALSIIDTDAALTQAKAADVLLTSSPPQPRPLEGIPLLVKDNIHVRGLPNTAGTPALAGFIPDEDCPVVARLRDAGAIVFAKSHMHELAYGITGYNPMAKHDGLIGARNAYNPACTAGGSSSGSGAAVGARMVVAALGSDTGGSVRIPSALNGVCGLRPSTFRYPAGGITPLAHNRDTAGPMAQTMADLELLDRVITGASPVAPVPLTTIRLGVVADFVHGLDSDTAEAFSAALDSLRASGVTVVELTEPRFFALHREIGFQCTAYEAYDDLAAYLTQYQPHLTVESVVAQVQSPDVRHLYETYVIPRAMPGPHGTPVPSTDAYHRARKVGHPALQALYESTFAEHALSGLVFPTVPKVAFASEDGCSSRDNLTAMLRHTGIGSCAGVPGISLPIGLGKSSGLPVGLGVDGARGKDRELLALGMSLQNVLGRIEPPAWIQQHAKLTN